MNCENENLNITKHENQTVLRGYDKKAMLRYLNNVEHFVRGTGNSHVEHYIDMLKMVSHFVHNCQCNSLTTFQLTQGESLPRVDHTCSQSSKSDGMPKQEESQITSPSHVTIEPETCDPQSIELLKEICRNLRIMSGEAHHEWKREMDEKVAIMRKNRTESPHETHDPH